LFANIYVGWLVIKKEVVWWRAISSTLRIFWQPERCILCKIYVTTKNWGYHKKNFITQLVFHLVEESYPRWSDATPTSTNYWKPDITQLWMVPWWSYLSRVR
jgi:hypothetical protein